MNFINREFPLNFTSIIGTHLVFSKVNPLFKAYFKIYKQKLFSDIKGSDNEKTLSAIYF